MSIFFALQFGDHCLNANTAQADAGTDGIDGHVFGSDGQFGFGTRITGNPHDFDDAVINFRNFLSKQGGQKFRAGARQENLRAFGFAADVKNISAHAVAVLNFSLGIISSRRSTASVLPMSSTTLPNSDSFNGSVNDGAHFFFVFFVLTVAFGVTHFLNDHLFGGLGGDAAEINRRQSVNNEVADDGVFL